MALKLEDKKRIVSQVKQVAENSVSALAANYAGLTAEQMVDLRAQAKSSGVHFQVVRNTLAKLALSETDYSCLNDNLSGQLMLAFSKEEPGAAARIVKGFMKENDALKVAAIAVGSQLIPSDKLDAVAALPTKDEAIAKLMSAMQAPITKLVRTLAEPQVKLVRTIAAIREQKESQ